LSGTDLRSPAGGVLRRAVGRGGYFALAFGAIVGSGWVVVLGDWLKAAGPGGVVLAFVAGGFAMVLIALCYGELASRFSYAGAEFLYVLETLGTLPGFLVGWYLTLYAVAVCAFEGIALGWILHTLLPAIGLGAAYRIRGVPVTWDALLIGTVGTLLLVGLHVRGAASAICFQNVVTFGFIALIAVLIALALILGQPQHLQPLFAAVNPQDSWLEGSVWIFGTCAFFLNGWQTALHAIEERRSDVTPRGAVLATLAAILVAALFYSCLVLAAASSVPWMRLAGQELPAVAAFGALTHGGLLGTVVLVAAAVSLLKAWSAMIWVGSRLIYAQARRGMLPPAIATIDPRSGVPRRAIVLVASLTLMGIALGRGAILPIVNMVSTCIALSFILCLLVLLRSRWLNPQSPSFAVPGGSPVIVVSLTSAIAMVGVALLEPWVHGDGSTPVEWILLVVWGGAGLLVWRIATVE
jgi:basic amino acid/polyamine antiporter, APA family